ncbi:MAG: hypothetical protein SXU28_06370 [Pseudomonadota bacterium]|nr:hypothetical protein [Pseudomonadota bacterium]
MRFSDAAAALAVDFGWGSLGNDRRICAIWTRKFGDLSGFARIQAYFMGIFGFIWLEAPDLGFGVKEEKLLKTI